MHKCVRCGNSYEDGDANIMRGCMRCGGIFFLYTQSPQDMQQLDAVKKDLENKDTTLEDEIIKQIEIKRTETKRKKKKPRKSEEKEEAESEPVRKDVIQVGNARFALEGNFDIETVRQPSDGVYEINIEALMKNNPLIVFERKNIYVIHLQDAFEKARSAPDKSVKSY